MDSSDTSYFFSFGPHYPKGINDIMLERVPVTMPDLQRYP